MRFLGYLCRVFLTLIFLLFQSGRAFPAEDIHELIAQGDAALARGSYEEAFQVAKAVLNIDPRNLTGYRFALTYCVMTHWEMGFNKLVEEAIRQ